jgi:hypothetical protein
MKDAWRTFPALSDAARRALPDEDPSIDALPTDVRERISEAWRVRAAAELSAGSVFAVIAHGLLSTDVSPEVTWIASRAVSDEIRHSELCLLLATRYAGREIPRPRARAVEAASGGPLLHAVANSAINEAIASVFLTASHEAASAPLAKAVLRELLTDEIDHARVGWALLGDPTERGADLRRDVETHLVSLVTVVRNAWLASASSVANDLPRAHGCLPGPEIAALVDEALREVVLPGMSHVGIDPRSALALLG